MRWPPTPKYARFNCLLIFFSSSICKGAVPNAILQDVCLSLQNSIILLSPFRRFDEQMIRDDAVCENNHVMLRNGRKQYKYRHWVLVCFYDPLTGVCITMGPQRDTILVFSFSKKKICSGPQKQFFTFPESTYASSSEGYFSWLNCLKFW